MNLKEVFDYILNNYITNEKRVDSTSALFEVINQKIPNAIKQVISNSQYKIYGSIGRGNKTKYPWIAVLNKEITTTTQEGLYLVYLFKSDMTGFYLSLNQGITNFKKKYPSKSYTYAQKVAKYFQDEINIKYDVDNSPIDLVASKGSLGYGYEKTNVISKYYSRNSFTEESLIEDLLQMLEIYQDVLNHMGSMSYNEVIEKVIYDENVYIQSDSAIRSIKNVLREEASYPRNYEKKLKEVFPLKEKSQRFKKLTAPVQTKIDHLKKAQENAYIGLEGEQLAMTYEMNRLINLGYSEYAEKVDWVSSMNDVAGYDIKSYDLIDGTIQEIYIEVKTSTSKVDADFYISKNELNTSNKFADRFYLFRIYEVLSINPKYYIAKGPVESNFYLEPVSYRATYKWSMS